MSIYQHATEFAGKPVREWQPGKKLRKPAETNYRISISYDEAEAGIQWEERFAEFLEDPLVGEVTGLVIGQWGESTSVATGELSSAVVVETLVAARERLPKLRAIFLGDIISEECEISWLRQSDVGPLFTAYPELEHFCVRGGEGLSLGRLDHARLKSLIVQSGGLGVNVVREVASAQLPALEHLELWLGTDDYGADASPQDLQPILSGQHFPRLRYLGLRDSYIADEIAQALVNAPILKRLEVLDLSLGVLTDDGAAALLKCPALKRLKKLDIHHHYCTAEMVEQLRARVAELDASEPRTADVYDDEEYRYVAVGE
jgi:hypothetical protein